MVFLNPAVLFGLIAASIPILIHLLNIKRLQRVEFSTLSFLKELQKSKIRKIKIKQWLLLLIRTLIIIALVLAFARPTLEGKNFLGSTSAAKTSIAFVIDNSFSMEYVGDEGSSFNKAKMAAKNIITNSEDGDEFIFILSNDSIQTTTSQESALRIIDNLKINFVTEYFTARLSKAVSEVSKSQNINKEIYSFSDFQKSTFNNKNILDTNKISVDENEIMLYVFDISSDQINNYSVHDLRINNSIIELNKPLTFSANIKNHSGNNVKDLNASLYINQKRVAQSNLKINSNNEVTVKFETTLETPGLKDVYIELEKDDIESDNYAYYSFFIPEQINILFYYDSNSDIFYLEKAVSSISASDRIKITKFKSSDIFNGKFSEFDIVFLISGKRLQNLKLKEYLAGGGNIIFLPPSSANNTNMEELIQVLELPDLTNLVSMDNRNRNYAVFGEINYQHPIYSSLFEIQNKKEIESPNFFKYLKFKNSPKITSIIKLIDGSVFLGEYNINNGTVLFLNSLPIIEWNTLPIKGVFAPLVSRIIYYLISQENKDTYFITGDELPIKTEYLTFPIIDAVLPNGTEKINFNVSKNKIITYSNTKVPGNYKFYNEEKLISYKSVNTNPDESYTEIISDNELKEFFNQQFNENFSILTLDENYMEIIRSARFGTELWKYFIMAALLLSLLEMYISRSRKSDLTKF